MLYITLSKLIPSPKRANGAPALPYAKRDFKNASRVQGLPMSNDDKRIKMNSLILNGGGNKK